MTSTTGIRVIRNGRVMDPANNEDTIRNLYIDTDGRISRDCPDENTISPEAIIDAAGKWVIPGLIDLSARFREPGHEHKADIRHESRAALSGGVTSVCIPPDTDPVIDSPAVVDLIKQKSRSCMAPHIFTFGAATVGLKSAQLSEIAALKDVGCIGISNAGIPVSNNQMMRNIMDYSASHGMKVFLGTQEGELARCGCAHEGRIASRMGLAGIPAASEIISVTRDLALIETTGVEAHFCRLSTARGVRLIEDARRCGLPVTADVAAHQLFLTENDVSGFNGNMHVLPPLRTERDRDALRQGIIDGVITAICSDHQPHEADAKLAPFAETESGMSTMDAFLPLILKLAKDNIISLKTLISCCTNNPAGIIGKNLGSLAPGCAADIAILNPGHEWTYNTGNVLSRGKNSPFNGWPFTGRVSHTLLAGRLYYRNDGAEHDRL